MAIHRARRYGCNRHLSCADGDLGPDHLDLGQRSRDLRAARGDLRLGGLALACACRGGRGLVDLLLRHGLRRGAGQDAVAGQIALGAASCAAAPAASRRPGQSLRLLRLACASCAWAWASLVWVSAGTDLDQRLAATHFLVVGHRHWR